ncbi:cytochrome P450 [Chelativorans sp. AA-79]|uniref:cytochrome P450 n=1 Tax=Chelativorans sp. AA-79 TaxID=3028735 RepID=UPI0023F72161|nr:cytochrome P450 [Chelativorans sp. AA-79]WEX09575.1 cytochrome P450 [Chelativorans sp. AA-79]
MSGSPAAIPSISALDSGIALWREGYVFVRSRCDGLGTDAFRTRIMMRNVVCMRGPAAAEQFYMPGRFTRRRAIPRTALALLQDWGSVQTLDGEAHRHRKQMFMDMMDAAGIGRAISIFRAEWGATLDRAPRRVRLHDLAREALGRTAILWCALPLEEAEPERRTAELSAMIEGAGSFGLGHIRARLMRRRCEHWARQTIEAIRDGALQARSDSPAQRIALHRGLSGEELPPGIAAVELLNLLRPLVAIARFVTFIGHALHVHRDAAAHLSANAADADLEAFVQEVRRFYPFFPMVGGRVLEPFSWAGHQFGKDDWVLLDLYGTNHHPDAWHDAETFDPQRFRGWQGDGCTLVPQGGGGFLSGHRCPGEWLTIALMGEAVRQLLAMDYAVPEQDLHIPMNRLPTLPNSGLVLELGNT